MIKHPKLQDSQISFIINSLISLIKNPKTIIKNNDYFYHPVSKNKFIIYLYLFKLTINDQEYLTQKYNNYISKYPQKTYYQINGITNIQYTKELDLLLKIKDKLTITNYSYEENTNKIIFSDQTYVDAKWLLAFLSLILDNTKQKENKEINIYYTIPDKNTPKLKDSQDIKKFLKSFTYYSIKVKQNDENKNLRENHILIVKNAAINYLKHLKQYQHGLENKDSYLIFYNLLKRECQKEKFELIEENINLLDLKPRDLAKIEAQITDDFYNYSLSKQIHIIENYIWQKGNDITTLEHLNASIDNLIDFLTIIRLENNQTYENLIKNYDIDTIPILLVLSINLFLLTYLSHEDFDYSLLDLHNIKPKYMNNICENEEQTLQFKLKNLNLELQNIRQDLDKFKKERNSLDSQSLSASKYQKELERCVGNINRASIKIGRLNSTIASLSKQYEEARKQLETKYQNIDIYNHNSSIIKHLCNAIYGCSFYLKTNNTTNILNNIIVFEDFEQTENSFYLELSLKDLLKISDQRLLNGLIEQTDLPKLA